jgi:hypothetical protein
VFADSAHDGDEECDVFRFLDCTMNIRDGANKTTLTPHSVISFGKTQLLSIFSHTLRAESLYFGS